MRWLLVILCLLVLAGPAAAAQTDSPPILALNAGGIYAVSPADGSVQTLVAPPADYDALHEQTHDPVTVFTAEGLSPDGQHLAFRTLRRNAPTEAETDEVGTTHALFVLDVQNGGDPIPVTLVDSDQARSTVYIESLAWSADGTRLYAAILTSGETSEAQESLVYVERGVWDNPVAVAIPKPGYAMARHIFATNDGIVVMDRGIQSPRYVFTLFDPDGQQVNHFEVDWNVSPEVNLYINTLFTPLLVDDTVRFGLVAQRTNELVFQIDFASGDVMPFDSGYFPGMISASAPDTSLRASAGYYDGDTIALFIRDEQNRYVGETGFFHAYAFGISGDSTGSTFTLSPDGQAIAYLENGALMLWQNGTATPLGFTAEALAWGPTRNIPVYDPMFLAG